MDRRIVLVIGFGRIELLQRRDCCDDRLRVGLGLAELRYIGLGDLLPALRWS